VGGVTIERVRASETHSQQSLDTILKSFLPLLHICTAPSFPEYLLHRAVFSSHSLASAVVLTSPSGSFVLVCGSIVLDEPPAASTAGVGPRVGRWVGAGEGASVSPPPPSPSSAMVVSTEGVDELDESDATDAAVVDGDAVAEVAVVARVAVVAGEAVVAGAELPTTAVAVVELSCAFSEQFAATVKLLNAQQRDVNFKKFSGVMTHSSAGSLATASHMRFLPGGLHGLIVVVVCAAVVVQLGVQFVHVAVMQHVAGIKQGSSESKSSPSPPSVGADAGVVAGRVTALIVVATVVVVVAALVVVHAGVHSDVLHAGLTQHSVPSHRASRSSSSVSSCAVVAIVVDAAAAAAAPCVVAAVVFGAGVVVSSDTAANSAASVSVVAATSLSLPSSGANVLVLSTYGCSPL
jgi:hypothetical protein